MNHINSKFCFLYFYSRKEMENVRLEKPLKILWIDVMKRSFCTAESYTLGISHCHPPFSVTSQKDAVCVVCLAKQYINNWIDRNETVKYLNMKEITPEGPN